MKVPAAFFEVSPQWAKVISEAKTVKELNGFFADGSYKEDGGNSLQNYNSCIVGEAHHFHFIGRVDQSSNDDYCEECVNFSNRFGEILQGSKDGYGNRKQQVVQNIEDFTNHWRQNHNPLVDMELDTEPAEIRA